MNRKSITIGGIILWLVWQLGALAIVALRIPLSARYPIAGEKWGLGVILVAQIAGISIFFTFLVTNFSATIITLALAWPMGELAGILTDAAGRSVILGECYVSAWIVTLFLWMQIARRERSRVYLSVLAAMISFGGPVIWYLHAEFNSNGNAQWSWVAALGPIVGALSQIMPDLSSEFVWIEMGMMILSALIILRLKKPRPAV
jgi:hypothetical protein